MNRPDSGDDRIVRIRALNDLLRRTFTRGGTTVVTSGLLALPAPLVEEALTKVREFDDFNEDNDPYGEHDFLMVTLSNGQKVFAKIDYYDTTKQFLSEDPSDPSKTFRVLTIMRAEDY